MNFKTTMALAILVLLTCVAIMDCSLATTETIYGYAVGKVHEAELSRNGTGSPLTRENQTVPQSDESYLLEVRTNFGDLKATCSASIYFSKKVYQETVITRKLGFITGYPWRVEVVR